MKGKEKDEYIIKPDSTMKYVFISVFILIMVLIIASILIWNYIKSNDANSGLDDTVDNSYVNNTVINNNTFEISSDYIGNWSDDTDGGNAIVIHEIKENKISFDLGIFRICLIENLTATMIDNNTATFDTNNLGEEFEAWEGVYGIIKFEDDMVTLYITESACEYIEPGLNFVCDHKIDDNY